MGCKTFDTMINEVTYATTQWSATKQMLMKFKLVSVFGDSIFELATAMTFKGDDDQKETVQTKALQSAMANLFKNSTPEKITDLLKEILTCGQTKRDGNRIGNDNFDLIYNEHGLKEMYQACFFVVKSNYSDFFKGQKVGELLSKVEESL